MSSWRDQQASPALVPSLAEKSKSTATNLRNGRAGQQLSNEGRNYDKDQWNATCRENCSTTYTAELCSQWLWISHVTWCKQTISLQCIYLKPGDLRDCCCGYWFSSHSSDVLRANNPISHERKKDLQERPPAVTIQSKVPLNSMFHHAADSK